MRFIDLFAKYLADRVPLENFPQWFQIEVTRQIQEMTHRLSEKNIDEIVEAYLRSDKF